MSVILLCLTLICSAVGYGGVGLRRPENLGYFLRYLDNNLATWPVLGQSQDGPFPKTHSTVVRIVDGDQNGNLAAWPVLSQYQDPGQKQDISLSKPYPDVIRNVDGDVTRNQAWQDQQTDTILGYILGDFRRRMSAVDKPEPPSKCTVQNNLKISSSNEPGDATGGKFEKLLKRYSYVILQRTEGLISRNQVEFQDQLVRLFEEMANRSASAAADNLLRAMEDNKMVSGGPQTKLGPEERNVTFSEYPRPDTEREGVTGPIFNDSDAVDVILRQTESLISRSQAELQDQLIKKFEEMTNRIISAAADKLLNAMEDRLINGRPQTKIDNGERTNVTTPKYPKLDTGKEVVTTPIFGDSDVTGTTAVYDNGTTTVSNNKTTTVYDNRTTTVYNNRTTTVYNNKTTVVAVLTTTPGSAVANSSSSPSWNDHGFTFPGTKLFGAEDGERDRKGDSGTNFTRTSQQMPQDDHGGIWNPFYHGFNRPSSLDESPHGLRRRPKSSEYQKPHY